MNYRYDKDGFYSTKEYHQVIEYLKGEKQWNEIPFNLLPRPTQIVIMEKLNAYYPTTCPHCGVVDEAAFLSNLGMKHCQHCSAQTGYVPIVSLPDLEQLKRRIYYEAGQNLSLITELKGEGFSENYTAYWALYLKARNLKLN